MHTSRYFAREELQEFRNIRVKKFIARKIEQANTGAFDKRWLGGHRLPQVCPQNPFDVLSSPIAHMAGLFVSIRAATDVALS